MISPESLANIQHDGKPVNGQQAGEPGRALTHGATADLSLAPRASELADYLREIVPSRAESDEPTIRLLALILARIETGNEWIAEHGIVTGKAGKVQPVLKVLSTWENSAARLCDQLGLTPTARARLGVDRRKGAALEQHLRTNYGGKGLGDE